MKAVVLCTEILLLSGCGVTGALYMPTKPIQHGQHIIHNSQTVQDTHNNVKTR